MALGFVAPVKADVCRQTVLRFSTMYGVDGPFLGYEIRGIRGDDQPWAIRDADGVLFSDGLLVISVRGLVFSDEATNGLVGKNDEPKFRAAVSCLTESETSVVTAPPVITAGFPATVTGNSFIAQKLTLPEPCVAPIIFILNSGEDADEGDDWFAVTGSGD
jgi:hypothetical protein